MGDLVTLYPAIVHLGGEGAIRGVVDEMRRVCEVALERDAREKVQKDYF
jgi:hypothetical protein